MPNEPTPLSGSPPQPDDKPQVPKNLSAIILILMALGVPTAAIIASAEWIVQHPWQAFGIGLLYELVVLVLGFVTKVWQKLESRWVERAAAWIDVHVQELFSRYRKRYLQHLIYRHRDFDVKGLTTQGIYTLALERVFVELTIVPRPVHRASTDPIQALPEELRQGRHTIWDYLRSEPLAGQSLAVIGPPGCGKTTLLKHMALTMTASRKQRRRYHAPDKLPVLLFLRNHAGAIQENETLPLAQAVRDGLSKQGGPPAPPGWFARQLERGCCLVMLDGLDEIADPAARKRVVEWVERQMSACHKNRFVVTSRPHGYRSNPLGKAMVLQVAPFDREQVRRFVHNWYAATEIMSAQLDDPGVRMKAREGGEDLLRRIRNTPALSALAVNPLLLTMIANVHRYRSSLPGRRVELYAEICEVFLGKRQESKGLEADLTPAQKQRVLRPLAYQVMREQRRELPLADAVAAIRGTLARVSPGVSGQAFLKMIEDTSGLLLERESGVYGFAHKTFQEYLAAVHIQEERLEDRLVERVGDDWWHETIRLYSAQADASAIIRACLAGERPAIPALTLAIECMDEAREVQPQVRARLQAVLDEGIEDEDPERRRIVAETLLALRLRRMVRVSEDVYVDPTPITHAEYQLFLDELRARGEHRQPDHWLAYQFPPGEGRAPVVGVRPSDAVAFCEWLTSRETGPWCYRLPRVGEIGVGGGSVPSLSQADAQVAHWYASGDWDGVVISDVPRPGLALALLNQTVDADIFRVRTLALALSLSRTRALARDLALALSHARDLARDLSRAHDLSRDLSCDLDLDLARDLALALSRARDLDLACALARDLARDLACARDLDLGLDLDLDRAHDLDLVLDLDYAFAHDFDLVRVLDFDLDRALDLDRARVLYFDGTLAIDLYRALDRTRAIDFARILVLGRDHAFGFFRARTFDLDRARALGSDLDRAIFLARARALDESGEVLSFLRWYVRLVALLVAMELLPLTETRSWGEGLGLDRGSIVRKEKAQRLIDYYLDLYVDFAILEARINGQASAFEGIRIVRERV